jgi:predicted ester cyclase
MDETATRTALDKLAQAMRGGDAQALAGLISSEWLDRGTRSGQPKPREVWADLTKDVFAAFGKPSVEIGDVRAEGDVLAAKLTVAGTHQAALWGLPPSGKRISVTATARVRLAADGLAVAFGDVTLIAVLREIGVVPQPETAHQPLVYPVSIPEMIMKMVFNGGAFEKPCSHLGEIRVTEPPTRRCSACVATGTGWPALRMCVTCGQVGCCDVAVGKHAKKHHEESGHPLVRSINADETWMWCYVDKTILSARK